jgi:ABC-type transporter MlaC component
MWQSSIRIAAVLTSAIAASAAAAQPGRPGGGAGAPHAAPAPAPHFSAPAAPHFAAPAAPHFSAPAAPHFSAPAAPHFAAPAAPHFSAPAPRIAPQMAAPPRPAPQIARPAPQQFARPSGPAVRHVPPQTFAAPGQPGGGRNLARPLLERGAPTASARVAPNLTRPNAPNRTVLPAGGNRPVATRALRNPLLVNRIAGGGRTALAHATFQGRFAGHHWQNWRRHRFFPIIVLGWLGPLYWPYAYNDFVDYTFYPHAYDTFWPYAYDDVYDGMFGRYAYDYGSAYAAVGQPGSAGGSTRRVGTDLCSGGPIGGLTDWPIAQIAQTVEPDDAQRAALDAVRDATARALDILKASCPTELPNTPTGRIEAMHNRLAAMLQAVRTVRPALDAFYQSLNDEQKARFNALGPDEQDQAQAQRDLSQACNERASGIASLPFDRIERAVEPDDAQRSALSALQDAAAQAVNLLQSDCPTYRSLIPTGRLEAMEQRLDAMLRAIEIVQPALARFYGSLSDEQKERFNRLSPAQG